MADRKFVSFENWCSNFMCRPADWYAPESVAAIQQIIRDAAATGRHVRPVGSGYSYTRLVQTDEIMISLDRWAGVESLDRDTAIAVVKSGTKLYDLEKELAARGFAMENLGDINKQTISGAISTGTHGTGITLGSISTRIVALELVVADATVRKLTAADGDLFKAACIALGTMGIITRLWIKVEPIYSLRIVRKRETLASALEALPANVAANRNYEFFWFPKSDLVYSKAMNIVEGEQGSGMTAGRWISDIVNENLAMWFVCTINHHLPASRDWLLDKGSGLVPQGTSVTRADAAYATERLVVHQEMEYAVPAERAVEVLRQLDERFRTFDTRTLFPVEVRFTRGDDLFLSASYGRDVAWIAVHTWWKEDHLEYFDAAETIFLAADGRPHWGKLHNLGAADFQKKYPKWAAFNAARRQLDPGGLFENRYLSRLLATS